MWSTPVNALPIISPDIVERLSAALSPWLIKAPLRALAPSPTRPFDRSRYEFDRQQRYFETVLANKLPMLAAMGPDTGRNCAAFRLVCRIGRWVHHGIVPSDRVTADVLDACERNGLVRDDGRRAVLATIQSALAKSAGDRLPILGWAP